MKLLFVGSSENSNGSPSLTNPDSRSNSGSNPTDSDRDNDGVTAGTKLSRPSTAQLGADREEVKKICKLFINSKGIFKCMLSFIN